MLMDMLYHAVDAPKQRHHFHAFMQMVHAEMAIARKQGVNRVPDDLYKNGLNRALFVPFIALIKDRMVVHPLDSDTDYRQGRLAGAARYFTPADLSRQNFNEAKRFVTLIDALYEARVQLICSAAAEPEMLYLEGEGTFEFERTASRLREMQSDDWSRD